MRDLARRGVGYAGRFLTPPTDRVVWLTIIKAALASAASYQLARWWIGSRTPVFAPLAAMLTVQATVLESVRTGVQRSIGVVCGVLVAFVFGSALGLHWWSIGLLVLLATIIGRSLALTASGATQVAVSAMLVLILSDGSNSYAIDRVLETVLGAAVGITFSLAIFPPVHVGDSGKALRELADALAAILTNDANAIREDWPGDNWGRRLDKARAMETRLTRAREAVKRGGESVQYNPLARTAQPTVGHQEEALRLLSRAFSMILGMTRAFAEEAEVVAAAERKSPPLPAALRTQLADVLLEAADVLRQTGRVVFDDDGVFASQDAFAALDAARTKARNTARRLIAESREAHLPTRQWLVLGSVLTDLRRLIREVDATNMR
ncbi:MAG TPA: FUSC family protein [Frankiaceae bacterium]|nr:FUSC family protein [Frankiaceae bacterium]